MQTRAKDSNLWPVKRTIIPLAFVSVLFVLTSARSVHDYFVGVGELTYQEKTKQWTYKKKVFTDDSEHALRLRFPGQKIRLAEGPSDAMDTLLHRLFTPSLRLIVNKKIIPFHLVKRISTPESTLLFYSTPKVPPPKASMALTFWDGQLMDYFPGQITIVHAEWAGNKLSRSLRKGDDVIELRFP